MSVEVLSFWVNLVAIQLTKNPENWVILILLSYDGNNNFAKSSTIKRLSFNKSSTVG